MSNSKTISVSTDFLVGVIVAFILLFYWPGPLRHQYTPTDAGLIRIDRITGSVSRFERGKYVPVRDVGADAGQVMKKLERLVDDLQIDRSGDLTGKPPQR